MMGGHPDPEDPVARLRILATSDLHMHLTGYDYFANRTDASTGLTRTASLISQAREEAGEALTLLFDNGDGFQGTPMVDLVAGDSGREHPLMRAFAVLGYDAIGLGNHDFNFGLTQLDAALVTAICPVVCSNLTRHDTPEQNIIVPFAVLDRQVRFGEKERPIRIGILSFLPPQTAKWDAHLLTGHAEVEDIPSSARNWVPRLRRDGCDLIVALAHSGLGPAREVAGMENAVIPLAAIEGIDVIIAGHTHLQMPGAAHAGLDHVDAATGAVHGKPVVMPGASGSHLGVIDLDLVAMPDGEWAVGGFRSDLRPIQKRASDGSITETVPEDPALVSALSVYHEQTVAMMNETVGHSYCPLHSYFTFFGEDRALAMLARAQVEPLIHLLSGTEAADLPILSAAAPSKSGGRGGPAWFTDVPAGPLSLHHVADLHVFPNEIRVLVLTGEQVLDWLEMSASVFCHIPEGGRNAALRDSAMPGHEFDVLFGLQYEIDLSVPAKFFPNGSVREAGCQRVRHVTWNGRLLAADDHFAVVVNNHRASGGGHVRALTNARHVPVPRIAIRDALLEHLAEGACAEPEDLASPWRFRPLPGTSVSARTGPGAKRYLHELESRGVTDHGLDPEGFLKLEIPL